jgi:adenine deaminase
LYASIKLVSLNAANAMGLNDRGSLAVGKKADFAVVQVQPSLKVLATVREGRVIYWSGQPLPMLAEAMARAEPKTPRIPLLAFIK